jgi:hypothetical protein
MQYPSLGILEIVWAPYHIFWNLERYCVVFTKLKRDVIASLNYIVNTCWIILVNPIRKVLFMPKGFNERAIPLSRYPKNTLNSITYLLKCGKVLHSLTKTYKETNTLMKVLQYWLHWWHNLRVFQYWPKKNFDV